MGNPLTNKIAFVGGGQMAEAIIGACSQGRSVARSCSGPLILCPPVAID